MTLVEYVTFDSLLRNDVISLDSPIKPEEEASIMDMTADESTFTEDDLIELIDKTNKLKVLRRLLEGLTTKELRIIIMRFGLGPFCGPLV